MRARDRDAPHGAGAEHGVDHGLVGIGDAHGDKADRMLRRFAELPDGVFVWTRVADGTYRLGRIAGPWRYDDSPAARAVGIHHVRPAEWLDRPFGEHEVPPAVAATFAAAAGTSSRPTASRASAGPPSCGRSTVQGDGGRPG